MTHWWTACDNNPCANGGECSVELNNGVVDVNCECVAGFSGDTCQDEVEEDSPFEEFLEDLMELFDPNGPIATPVATIGVLGKSTIFYDCAFGHFLYQLNVKITIKSRIRFTDWNKCH